MSEIAGTATPPEGASIGAPATDQTTSAQATPPAPVDPSEILASLSADELAAHPAVKKLLDDQAAKVKAATARKLDKKQKPKPQAPPSQPTASADETDTDTDDGPPAWVADLLESNEALRKEIDDLKAARSADTFDAAWKRHQIPDEYRADAETLAKANGVKDTDKFLSDFRARYLKTDGVRAGEKGGAAAPTNGSAVASGSPSPGTAPGAPPDLSGTVDPFRLSREQVHALAQRGQLMETFEQHRQQSRPGFGRRRRLQETR